MIYFDQSATSLHKPLQVIEAVREALDGGFGNPARGAHQPALSALKAIAKARRAVAGYFGVPAMKLAFTVNATMALNFAIHGVLTAEDRVITSCWAHNAMLRPLYQLQDQGMRLRILAEPHMIVEQLEAAIQPDTTALALNAMSNVTGEALPLAEVIDLCCKKDVLLILDLAQWAGVRSLPKIQNWPRALIVFTGHKSLYGPMGSGGLINMGQVPLVPHITGGSGIFSFNRVQPLEFPDVCEVGTPNLPAILGLMAGIQWIQEIGQEQITAQLTGLRNAFVQGLAGIPGITVYGECNKRKPSPSGPVVSLNVGQQDSAFVSQILSENYGIATRPGAHCAPLWHEAMDTKSQGAVRFSFSYFNTLEQVETALCALSEIAGQT